MREVISPLLVNEIVTSGTTNVKREEKIITDTIPATVSAKARRARGKDPITTAEVAAIIGPINGATIMAPITVAVELERTPYVAMTVANKSNVKKFVRRRAVWGPSMKSLSSKVGR